MARGESFVKELTDILVRNDVIKAQEGQGLHQEFEKSDQVQFDDFILEEGIVSKDDLLTALADYYQVPFLDSRGYFFDHNLLVKFPQDFLVRNGIIPMEVDENIMIVVANDPGQEGLESAIRNFVSYDIEFWVGLRQPIIDSIREYYQLAITEEPQDITVHDQEEEFEAEEDIVDVT